MLPAGFVYLNDPRMIFKMSYATQENFMGRAVQGYTAPVCIVTEPAAKALIQVQNFLDAEHPHHYLKIFDTYRPTTAVDDFIEWSKDPNDQKMKAEYYPDIEKPDLFTQGYIGKRSAHSRGSTVDLTITFLDRTKESLAANNIQDKELDMGTPFDFFGELSHTENPNISSLAKKNRQLLIELMSRVGFENYPVEWWHFTLKDEPFPESYFNFPVAL